MERYIDISRDWRNKVIYSSIWKNIKEPCKLWEMFNGMKLYLHEIPHCKIQIYLYKEYLEDCPLKQPKGNIPKCEQWLALVDGTSIF